MPNYKGHLAGGAVAFGCTLVAISPYQQPLLLTTIEWFACTLAGALFPDIDIKSKGQKYFYLIILIVLAMLLITKRFTPFAVVSILALTPMLSNHRGLFHRTWFVVGVPLLVWYIIAHEFPVLRTALLYDTIFFIAGALSHLWLDLGLRKMVRL